MKKMLWIFSVVSVVFCCPLWACESANNVNVSGNVSLQGLFVHGDSLVGGWSSAEGAGSYNAQGRKDASGETGIDGYLSGSSSRSEWVSSQSSALVSTFSRAERKGFAEISGKAEQANWVNFQGSDTLFWAGNQTSAGFQDYSKGFSPNIDGMAYASGSSGAYIWPGNQYANTYGEALAVLGYPSKDPWANGSGILGVFSTFQGEGFAVQTNGLGSASFNASGQNQASGSLKVNYNSSFFPSGGGGSVSFYLRSGSQASAK